MQMKTAPLNKEEFNALITIASREARTPSEQLRRFVQEAAGLVVERPPVGQPTRSPRQSRKAAQEPNNAPVSR